MDKKLKYILRGLFIAALVVADVCAATSGSRSAVNMERARAVGTAGQGASAAPRTKQPIVLQRGNSVRSGRNVSSRSAIVPNRSQSTVSRATSIFSDAGNTIIRRALGLGRAATMPRTSARSAVSGTPRSGVLTGASRSRATAVFSDISKLGEGYNSCRDAYNTCMDQFCAGANETYRRCYCSNGFRNLRDKEDALDAATQMLAKFEDNNLNAVNKTAEEVNAMYSATAGEQAIKNDTSGAAELLNDIGDLLSGKKKAADTNVMTSLGGLSVDFSANFDDIWGTNTADMFSGNAGGDLASLEGAELYAQAHTQCMQLVGSGCDTGAVKNMVKSAYSILITQDCNAYQKKVDAKTEQVKTTVRTAEKYLREARLEEYRSHNSADVNECMDKVEKAILQPTACGADMERCLDYTGVYINSSTGEPIYTPRLFGLNKLIVLDGSSGDVLAQNKDFDTFLDSKRMYAKSALDTCRDIADTVWYEFKRNALIKIAQAQDEKIEEVKMSCVSTMKECYDTQSAALKGFDDTTAQASGALAARASRDMCSDKVLACAALYAKDNSEQCKFDNKGNIKNANDCGLASLLHFVDTVDDTRIAEGCGVAVENYLKQLCTPTVQGEEYPWNCRLKRFTPQAEQIGTYSELMEYMGNKDTWKRKARDNAKGDLIAAVVNYAFDNCAASGNSEELEPRIVDEVERQLENLYEQLIDQLADKCEAGDGIWIDADATTKNGLSNGDILESFYSVNFGKNSTTADNDYGAKSWGVCVRNNIKSRCDAEDKATGSKGWATYDASIGQCRLSVDYYKYQCDMIRGVWGPDNRCYIKDTK